jgi:hypothetical protein
MADKEQASTQQIVLEQSRKRKRSLDLKGKAINSLVLEDFTLDTTNQEVCSTQYATPSSFTSSLFIQLTLHAPRLISCSQ